MLNCREEMMPSSLFSPEDHRQIREHGVHEERVVVHIDSFRKPPPYLRLKRPCHVGDGVRKIPADMHQDFIRRHQEAANQGRLLKFVPASGAASRMFKVLLWFYENMNNTPVHEISRRAEHGDQNCKDILIFFEGIERFAFLDDLKASMAKEGLDTHTLLQQGDFEKVLEYLLTPRGLNYSNLPKGLLKFHRYPGWNRTAFEEHLVEAAEYVRDARGNCRLHFTVSPEHRELFESLSRKVLPLYERNYNARLQVDFSIQKPSTDTVAVDMNDQPFRLHDGRLLFRPAGHGALIENLNDLAGDVVFVKNIDNVVPDRLKAQTFLWKKILAGYLIEIQRKIFGFAGKLQEGARDRAFLDKASTFAREELCLSIPQSLEGGSGQEYGDFLLSSFDRPVRVCGVVRNYGEPGGGPFWVEGQNGTLSPQIVEKAQVDPSSSDQEKIWASATHFNPVDIVCGILDYKGNPFDLRRYVDENAYIITFKSHSGRGLKALERPGLWNGSMAYWTTIFVEVPIETFNPVKTVLDLLRDEHQ